jgi:hypothetical protein
MTWTRKEDGKMKLEGSEIWAGKVMSAQERADGESAHEAALEKVQNWIFSNLSRIRLTLECEDGEQPATMADLQSAVNMASTKELAKFMSTHTLPCEDGYLVVSA